MKKRKTLGIALGSGAARGIAAIGVLKVLENNGIKIDEISGTSMGAVIGAAYGLGFCADRIQDFLITTDFRKLLDFNLPLRGIIRGKKLENYLRKKLENKRFGDLKIPLSVVAVDLNKRREVIFKRGDLTMAVRASVSIPVAFNPVKIKDMRLVDGAVLNPVPVDLLKTEKTIAVDVNTQRIKKPITKRTKDKKTNFAAFFRKNLIKDEIKNLKEYTKSKRLNLPLPIKFFLSPEYVEKFVSKSAPSFEILKINEESFSILIRELSRLKLEKHKPDVLIRPKLHGITALDFDKYEQIIKKGEIEAKKHISKIKEIANIS